jgi:acyl-CoA synthetase (AMP-forming)/AMP-acid ligase II
VNADPAQLATDGAPPGAESLATLLEYWASRQGDAPALTFLDYTTEPEVVTVLSWRELDELADAIASWVRPRCGPGDRVAIMVEQSPYFIASFLGVIRARLIAVPLYPPGRPRADEYLAEALADCLPSMLLTTWNQVSTVEQFLERCGVDGRRVVAVDAVPSPPRRFRCDEPLNPDDIAYLQYTSRSPNSPAGVLVSHANVLANTRQAIECYQTTEHTVSVSWLPLSHCMGLALSVHAPLVTGKPAVLLDPAAFQEAPVRWLRALSAAGGSVVTAAPTSAYVYTATRTTQAERADLRLDGVMALIDANESVHDDGIAEFHEAFAECGLPRRAYRPCYGLAEATVLVSTGPTSAEPARRTFDGIAVHTGRAVPLAGAAAGVRLVSSGRPAGQRVLVVDPATRRALPEGRVGEIWVSGPNVARGYWGRLPRSPITFGARPAEVDGDVPVAGMCGEGWLRTGDLGALVDGELFVTGQLEDMIIVAGREHYPQEIERTAVRAHPAVRRHAAAAFTVPGEQGDRLVILAERTRGRRDGHLAVTAADVTVAVRSAVQAAHGLPVHDVWLLGPGEIPRAPNGKISRSSGRDCYLSVVEPRSSAS